MFFIKITPKKCPIFFIDSPLIDDMFFLLFYSIETRGENIVVEHYLDFNWVLMNFNESFIDKMTWVEFLGLNALLEILFAIKEVSFHQLFLNLLEKRKVLTPQ